MIQIPNFANKSELFTYLRENKDIHIAAKKAVMKCADAVEFHIVDINENQNIISKAEINPDVFEMDKFNVKVVINTTNIMDSHSDVHLPNIWNKSLKETKNLYLLKEHKMSFENIISDKVKATAVMVNWSDLGFKYQGQTQALIFDAEINKADNEFMANLYAKDKVKNHSVGMRYIKLDLAMNSESKFDIEEKKIWDKYINQIANKEAAEEQGYFWAVTEAKIIEGSAVPLGSNFATPTISVGKTIIEPDTSTQNEPINITLNIDKMAEYLKTINN